jgi:dienelactone hydrolase
MRSIGLCALAALVSLAGAQTPRFVYPAPPGATILEQLPGLDIYRPKAPATRSRPVAIFLAAFGGAVMRHGSQFAGWGQAAATHGFVAVVADDVDSAFVYLGRHAAELHVDPQRAALVAWSAHAGAGIPLAEDERREAIKAAVFLYGSGPVEHFRLDLPVLFVRAGLDQPSANAAIDALIASALRANAPWSVINYSAGRHGFDGLDDNAESRAVIERALAFLRSALSDSIETAMRSGLAEAAAAGAVSRGDYVDAAARYATLTASDSVSARLHLAYGNALLGAARYHDALTQFDRAKALGGVGVRDLGIPAAHAAALDHDPDGAIAWLRTIPPQFLPDSIQYDTAFASLTTRADFRALYHH